jgi:hypothetical protein
MSLDIPEAVASYLDAENRGGATALERCFATDAVVCDEGETIEGLPAIQRWKLETTRKYRHRIEPLAVARSDDKTIVASRLTGSFPSSPIELRFIFVIEGEKIVSPEIRP